MMKAEQTLNVVVSGKGKSIFWNKNMNERIKELAKQAGGEFYIPAGNQTPTWYFKYDDCQWFAQLIVRECANLPFKSTGEVTTIGEIAVSNMILKHFGVQE